MKMPQAPTVFAACTLAVLLQACSSGAPPQPGREPADRPAAAPKPPASVSPSALPASSGVAAASAGAPTAARQPAAAGNAATVQRMPQVLACNPSPRAVLMGSGPGQELFSVVCANGYGLLVQCVSGDCKVMN